MLLPPDLTDWAPDDHLVWSVLGAVEQMDLGAFYGGYRENGQGRSAYEPSMIVALLLYSYARGNRSSRGIERACREDVTYKLITAMRVPDHSTIAEFRRRHERALGELFTAVLALCREAGLVRGWGDLDRWCEDPRERVAGCEPDLREAGCRHPQGGGGDRPVGGRPVR
jgi:transposase